MLLTKCSPLDSQLVEFDQSSSAFSLGRFGKHCWRVKAQAALTLACVFSVPGAECQVFISMLCFTQPSGSAG